VVGRDDGGPLLILEEGENEVSDKKNSACELAAADVVNALPAVKRSVTQMFARAATSNGTRRFGSIGPQDLGAPEGFPFPAPPHELSRRAPKGNVSAPILDVARSARLGSCPA
jgi:hypothetical protein